MLAWITDLIFMIAIAGAIRRPAEGAIVARVGDLDKPPQIKAPKPSKQKKPSSRKRTLAQEKTSSPTKRPVKTITVELLGATYVGWYWIEKGRLYVTYHEQPMVAEPGCNCCSTITTR